MVGVLIYQNGHEYYNYVEADDGIYAAMREQLPNIGRKILWERANTSSRQINDSRKAREVLIKRLGKGEEIDLEAELADFFG